MVHLVVLAIALVAGVLFYIRSVKTRKIYHCPRCQESFQVEHMTSSRCSTCGAPVKRDDQHNITDKP